MNYKNKNIFVSFHHDLNQDHANKIRKIIRSLGHNDISVNEGTKIENEENKTDEEIRREIRDNFLRNVDVTIVLIGSDSVNRKHIDWEIRSTLHKFDDGKNGSIVVINALKNDSSWMIDKELTELYDNQPYPAGRSWPQNNETTLETWNWLPNRLANSIVDKYDYDSCLEQNFKHAVFPIVSYKKVKEDNNILQLAIEQSLKFKTKNIGKWDLNSKMRRQNNQSPNRKLFEQHEA